MARSLKGFDERKLSNVVHKPGKTVARCPACAAVGGDRQGVHLVIYPNGAFDCVAFHGDKIHRRQIKELAGTRSNRKRGGVALKWLPLVRVRPPEIA